MSEPACSICGLPTWPDCGFTLATMYGPTEFPHPVEDRCALLICSECRSDTKSLCAELEQRAYGCCLHITIGDHNISDDSIAFCRTYASKRQHTLCEHVCDLLAAMTVDGRRVLFGCEDGDG